MSRMYAQATRLASEEVRTLSNARRMRGHTRLAALLVAAFLLTVSPSAAQVRTAVRDVLYNADGSRASGQIEISWNAFAAADGKTIAAGKITRRITDGVLDVSLVPTEGATPEGAGYAVSYMLSSGISYSETWSVPATGPVRLSAVRVLPPVHLPAETVLPLNQLSQGTGLSVLLGLARYNTESAPAPSASGQCYWDTTVDQMLCAQSDLTYAAAAGGGGGATWGSITGRLENQTDLQSALQSKLDTNTPAGGELSGSYPSPVIGATISGSKFFTGSIDSRKINAIRFAHQFAGANAGAKIAAATADLPATGGTVDARGLEGAQAIASDIFSGVTKPLHLLLGGSTYTLSASVTVPENVTLAFSPGARWDPSQGITVTVAGGLENPDDHQIFGGSGVSIVASRKVSVIRPQWWGCLADDSTDCTAAFDALFGRFAEDGAITAADATLTSASMSFTASDTGRSVTIYGAGPAGASLETTIASVTSATEVELAAAASTTVTGANTFIVGTVAGNRSKRVHLPKGVYKVTRTITPAEASGVEIFGDGDSYLNAASTTLKWYGASGGTVISSLLDWSRVHDFLIDGNSTAGRGWESRAHSARSAQRNRFERIQVRRVTQSPSEAVAVGTAANLDVSQSEYEHFTVSDSNYGLVQRGSQTVQNIYRYWTTTANTVDMQFQAGDARVENSSFLNAATPTADIDVAPAAAWATFQNNYHEIPAGYVGNVYRFATGTRNFPTLLSGVRVKYDAGNLVTKTDAAITTGTKVLTSASSNFVAGDVGRPIQVVGAGAGGTDLRTYIATVDSAIQVTLALAASTTVSGGTYYLGGKMVWYDQTGPLSLIGCTFDHANPGLGSIHVNNAGGGQATSLLMAGTLLGYPKIVARTNYVGMIADFSKTTGYATNNQSAWFMESAGLQLNPGSITFGSDNTKTDWKWYEGGGSLILDDNAGNAALTINTSRHVTAGVKFIGPLQGNADTATALASDPSDCTGNTFAVGIASSGAASCAQPAFSQLSGAASGSQLPNPGVGVKGGVEAKTCSGTDKVSAIGNDGIPVCSGDQTSGAGNGISSLNGLTTSTQLFSKADDANVTLAIGTSGLDTHTFTLGWTGALAKTRQNAATVYADAANTWTTGAQDFAAATSLTLPTSEGAAPASAGGLAYDSTAHAYKGHDGSGARTFAFTDSSISGNAATATALAADPGDCTGSNFALGIAANGAAACAQPAFSNLSGAASAAQLPNPAAGAKGGVEAKTCAGDARISAIGTDGVPVCSPGQNGGYVAVAGDSGVASKTGTEAAKIVGTAGEIATVAADGSPDDTVTVSLPATLTTNKTVSGAWSFMRSGVNKIGLYTSVAPAAGSTSSYGVNVDMVASAAGSLGDAQALSGYIENNGSGVMGYAAGLYIFPFVNSGAGSITNVVGIEVDNQDAGGSNWAIRTGRGLVEHSDVLKLNGNATSKRQLALPSMGGDPASPVSGDVWNNAGVLKFYNSSTHTFMFGDTSVQASQLPNPGAGSKGGVESKTCTGTDKLSAIGTDGIPVCSADQSSAGGGYTTIQEEASPLTQRTTLNFIGPAVTAADDAGNTRTNVTVVASGTGACAANTWASTLNDGAAPTCTQPASSNLSDSSNLAKLDAANTFSHTSGQSMVALSVTGTTGNTLAVDTNTLLVDAVNHRVGIARTPGWPLDVNNDMQVSASGTGSVRMRLSPGAAGYGQIQAAASGRPLRFINSSGTTILEMAESNGALTNTTLDAEGTANTISAPSKIYMIAAGCDNATAGAAFDLPTSGAAGKACLGTTATRFGVLTYADAATSDAYTSLALPSDWTATGGVDIKVLYTGDTSSANAIRWSVRTACVADGEDLLAPIWHTASAANVAGPTTAGQRKSNSFTGVTVTNCVAGETMYINAQRIGGDAGDTYTGVAQLLALEVTIRRAM